MTFATWAVGASLGRTVPLTSDSILAFGKAGGDESPSHFSDAEAQALGYPSAIAHGMYVMAQAGRLLTEEFPDARIELFTSRFTAMAFHGDEITIAATVTALTPSPWRIELAITATNQARVVVATGTAKLGS